MSWGPYPEYQESGVAWLGSVPHNWTIKRFRFVFLERSDKIEGKIFGEMLSVSGYRGVEQKSYDDENRRRSDQDLQGYRIVLQGQLVVNTMWMNYAGLGVSNYDGHVSPAYRAYDISPVILARYAHHLLRSEVYVKAYTAFLTGIRPNSLQMSREDLSNFPILLPPANEQAAIAAFLDRETGRIDALVAEQERLIALLKEKRQAVISHAVTRGLNPDAPMKDSGVAWLGEVPAHWMMRQLKHVIAAGSSISYGIVQPGEPQDEGVPFVQTTNMTSGQFNLENLQKTTHSIAKNYPRSRINGGEVLLGIRASIGAAYVAPPHLQGANLSRGVARIEPGKTVLAEYIVAFLKTENVSEYWMSTRQGSTFNEVSIETVREMWVLIPSICEQRQLINWLRSENLEFDTLTTEATRAIALLRERRAALISAAVTGRIDVRIAAPAAQAAA